MDLKDGFVEAVRVTSHEKVPRARECPACRGTMERKGNVFYCGCGKTE